MRVRVTECRDHETPGVQELGAELRALGPIRAKDPVLQGEGPEVPGF